MHTKKKKYALCHIDVFLIALFAVFLSVITTAKIIEDDVFIHLVTGKYIVENKTVPSADVFGYVTEGTEWIPYEWLWQGITYLVWRIGDYELLSVLRTVIIILCFLLFYLMLKKFKVPAALIIVIGVLACFGMLGRLVIRPHIVSYLFMVILLCILFNYKFFDFRNKKFLYFIPAIFLIWANVHMGVILGLVVFGIFLFSETAAYIGRSGTFRKNKNTLTQGEIKIFYLIFLISFAAVFINPHFAGTYIYVYDLLAMPELEYINEWASPFDGRFISGYYVKIYIIFLFLGLSILYYSYKQKELFPVILYLVIGIFSMRSLRYTSDFIIVIFIPLVISLNYVFKCIRLKSSFLNTFPVKLAVSALLIFLIIYSANNDVYRVLKVQFRETGFGVNENYFSSGLFDFMKNQRICEIGSRPFNSLRIGGYFLWSFEGKKNFIDSRCLSGSIINEYYNINFCRDDFAEKLKYYDVDYIIYSIPTFASRPIEIEMNLAAYLSRSDNWKLVYWDDISFLFLKNDNKFADVISKFEYKYLTPINCFFHRDRIVNAMKKDNTKLMNEINRKLSEDRNSEAVNDIIRYLNLKSLSSLR